MKKKYIAVLAVAVIAVVIVGWAYFGSVPVLSSVLHGQSKVLITQSSSMSPAIKQGASIAYDDTVPFSSLEVDDVIVFRNEGNYIVARITAQTGNTFEVKGDANPHPYPFNATQENT